MEETFWPMNKISNVFALCTAFIVVTFFTSSACAITLDDGDYSYMPDGTTLGLIYTQHVEGRGLYSKGKKVSDDVKLTSEVQMLRYVKYVDWKDYAFVPQFLLPMGSARTGGDWSDLGVTNGVGDLLLVLPFHFIKDPTGREAFAITAWGWLPTGDYDNNNELNPFAENRWKLALQAGRQWKVNEQISLELVADVRFHGDNDEYGVGNATLEQKPLWELQGHVRYYVTPRTFVGAMVSNVRGGATRVDGIELDDSQNLTKLKLSIGHSITPDIQLIGSVGQDMYIRNGIKEEMRVNFRLLKLFK